MYKSPIACRVTRNHRESDTTCTVFVDRPFDVAPGQFLMVWIPGFDEKPFSPAYTNGLTVKVFGPFSQRLFDLQLGEQIWLRGPYGVPFPLRKRMALIGGGVGIAPLRLLVEKIEDPLILLGGRVEEDLLYRKEFEQFGEVRVATEDGSAGVRGLITDLLPVERESVAVCGPERMMAAVYAKLTQRREDTYFSLERYFKCGMGLCGHCTCSGYRVCVDGPVFDGATLATMPDFGKRRRLKSGRWGDV